MKKSSIQERYETRKTTEIVDILKEIYKRLKKYKSLPILIDEPNSGNVSKSAYGVSGYLYVRDKTTDFNQLAKVRVSDHEISNPARVIEETQIMLKKNPGKEDYRRWVNTIVLKIRKRIKELKPKKYTKKEKASRDKSEINRVLANSFREKWAKEGLKTFSMHAKTKKEFVEKALEQNSQLKRTEILAILKSVDEKGRPIFHAVTKGNVVHSKPTSSIDLPFFKKVQTSLAKNGKK